MCKLSVFYNFDNDWLKLRQIALTTCKIKLNSTAGLFDSFDNKTKTSNARQDFLYNTKASTILCMFV